LIMDDKRIYVIDDDAVMRMSCQQILSKESYTVEIFEDGEKGLTRVSECKPKLIVVDLKMPKIGGLEVINRVHEMDQNIVIIVITGYATVDTAVEAMKAGAYDFLPKPFTPDELRLIVYRALERQELIEESARLRKENEKMQRQFITFVSHQLQSPLAAVQQYLDVLEHIGDVPNRDKLEKEWLQRSHIKIKELLTLIKDWLKISKIESGSFAERARKIAIMPLIKGIYETFEKSAKDKGLSIELQIQEPVSDVLSDEECLSVLLSNLVENAIKYNKQNGRVTISVMQEDDLITISVADTGIGISEEDLNIIFEEFRRIKNESTRDIAGTGLGLTICKKIIHEMGGEIQVQSKLGEGSTFTVRIPVAH